MLVRTAFAGAGTTLFDLLQEWRRPSIQRAIANSLTSSFGAMLVSLVLGGAAAILLAIARMRGRRAFAFLFTLSMLIAPHVAALAFKTLLGPASPVLQAIGIAPPPGSANPLLSLTGIILVLGLHHAPIVMLTLLAGMRTIPHDLIEAAQVDGARPSRILRDLVMPLLAGHWLAAGLLAFVAAFGNFGIPALLGLPVNIITLPTLIYRQLSSFGPNVLPDVAGLSLLTMMVGGLIIVLAVILLGRRGTALEPERQLKAFWTPGPLMRAIIIVAGTALLMVALLLPLLSLLASSLVPSYGVALTAETLTTRAYAETLLRQAATREAFRTSLGLAGLAAILLAIAAVPMAFAIHRFAGRSRALLMLLIELPYALPGIVIAIAAILLFLRPLPVLGISLYATPWIILAAYLVRFLPLAVKPALASMATLSPNMEEAGALCGARMLRRLATLIVPTLLPALCAGGLMVFLTAFSELTVSALLWSAGSRTLGVVVYGLEEAGLTTEASALGVVTILVVGIVMAMIDALRPLLPDGSVPWFVSDDEKTGTSKLS
ncbi:MAG: iron ABC transporter permease [Microcystis sp. LE19-4.1E]|nr:iron ABC transporter permease [Microcystis sp. LE19-4.1E]